VLLFEIKLYDVLSAWGAVCKGDVRYFEFKIEKDKIFEIMMQNVRYFDLEFKIDKDKMICDLLFDLK